MKNPKRPNLRQKKIISKAGLNPDAWSVTWEDMDSLYLAERHFEGRAGRRINKNTLEVSAETFRREAENESIGGNHR